MRFVRLILIILILGTPLGAYVPRRTMTLGGLAFQKWADASFPVTWRLNSIRGGNVTGARDLGEVFRQAFQTWNAVSTARVSFAEGASTNVTDAAQDGINLVSVTPAVYNLDVPSTTILYTVTNPTASQFPGQIVEADILFNPQTLLSTDVSVPQDRYDLQSLAVHEIGHLLGLDHSGLASAAMFPTSVQGSSLLRTLDLDDVLGVSNLYPTGDLFASRGTVHGLVRAPSGAPAFEAHVVLVDGSGKPVASTLTDPDGSYFVRGLEPGNYSAYAEPLDQPLTAAAVPALGQAFPNQTPSTAFTTRFAATVGTASTLTLTKTGGDVAVSSLTSLTAKFTIALTATLGPRDVTVVTAGGTSTPVTFTVNGPPCTPIAFGQTINGSLTTSDYPSRAGVFYADCYTFSGNSGDPGVIRMDVSAFTAHLYLRDATGQVVASEDRRIPFSGSFALPSAGTFTIEATSRFSGQTGAYTLTLTSSPLPAVAAIQPNSGTAGSTVAVTLTGLNLSGLSTPVVAVSGSGVTATCCSSISSTSVGATFTISSTTATGMRNVTLTTSEGTSAPVTFTVNAP